MQRMGDARKYPLIEMVVWEHMAKGDEWYERFFQGIGGAEKIEKTELALIRAAQKLKEELNALSDLPDERLKEKLGRLETLRATFQKIEAGVVTKMLQVLVPTGVMGGIATGAMVMTHKEGSPGTPLLDGMTITTAIEFLLMGAIIVDQLLTRAHLRKDVERITEL